MPAPQVIVSSIAAMPDDATCAHHPSKRASATCAGSGDYICPLCAVELNGQTFSAQYLESAGKQTAGKAFERYLDRPDRAASQAIILSFLFAGCFFVGPIAVPYAIYQFFRMLKLRRSDPFYARLVTRRNTIALGLVLGLMTLLNLAAAVLLGVVWIGRL